MYSHGYQKELQKKSAQYSGLSFLSALSTPTTLTLLSQIEAPLWFSFVCAFVFLSSTLVFYFKYNRISQIENDLRKDNKQVA